MQEVKNKEYTCICCPLGCQIKVTDENGEIKITGNNCQRGENYVKAEMTNPTRMVTTMVQVKNGEIPVVSVKTKEAIPKERVMDCIDDLKGVIVEAPVKIGDVILENVAGTDIPVVATKSVEKI